MRNIFLGLTILLVLIGFIIPLAWVGAAISGVVAVASSPTGLRADGKKKSGGLLGGFVDSVVVGYKMDDCPYCGAKIMHDAAKCKHCGEWVEQEIAD